MLFELLIIKTTSIALLFNNVVIACYLCICESFVHVYANARVGVIYDLSDSHLGAFDAIPIAS